MTLTAKQMDKQTKKQVGLQIDLLTEPHSSPVEHYAMTISLHLTMPCTCTLFVLMLEEFYPLKKPYQASVISDAIKKIDIAW